MLAVIIFMMLVYRESLKESCLSYEKIVNEFKKICNQCLCGRVLMEKRWELGNSYKKIMKFLDEFYKWRIEM